MLLPLLYRDFFVQQNFTKVEYLIYLGDHAVLMIYEVNSNYQHSFLIHDAQNNFQENTTVINIIYSMSIKDWDAYDALRWHQLHRNYKTSYTFYGYSNDISSNFY